MNMKRIEYIGPQERYSEVAITGQQQVWIRGQSGFVEDNQVDAFIGTGLFRQDEAEPMFVGNGGLVDKLGLPYPASLVAVSRPAVVAIRRQQAKLEAERSALAQAPLWAANTAYVATDVVRLSTGPLLLCTTAGTSHATTEPTITIGSAPAEITDNTAKWWALSEATRVAPSGAIAVTVTDNAGNSALGSIVNFFDNSAQFDQLSAPNVYTPGGAGSTKYCTAWSMLDGSTNDGGFGTNGKQGKYRTIEFVTNADLFEIGYFAITANFLNERVRIWVEGYGTSEAPIIPGAQGASRFWRIAIPGGRRRRLVRIAASGASPYLRYVGVAADCVVEKPTQTAPVLGWFSDSFGDTESPAIGIAHYDLAPQVGKRLGMPHVMHGGSGGTSYALSIASSRQNLQWVLANNDWTQYNFAAIINGHGYNAGDPGNNISAPTEAAAALVCWNKQRALWPTAPIVVIGPWYVRTGVYIAPSQAVAAALKAQFLAWGDKRSAYIDPFDGSITAGDGTVIRAATSAWIGTANAAWVIGADAAHPSPAGAWYLQDCIARSADAALNYLGV